MSLPCSVGAVGEPLAGTAPHSRGWLVLEHAGPYPRIATDALGDVAEPLRQACKDAGITLLLARRERTAGRRAFLARDERLLEWADVDPAAFLHVDAADIGGWTDADDAHLPSGATVADEPVMFVCTNGKRDACCAQFGRPVADALMREDARVWECSHIGGHRLAPTAVLLPFGSVHGRLTVESARTAFTMLRDGRCALDSLRGLSHLASHEQVADIAVRRDAGIDEATRLVVRCAGDDSQRKCTVAHPDGREWQVSLVRRRGDARAESCGKEPLVTNWWAVQDVRAR